MLGLKPALTPKLEKHVGKLSVARAPAFRVTSYAALVREVAGLAFLNRENLLFFRGQASDYLNKVRGSSLYPSIYRGDQLARWEVQARFDRLQAACEALVRVFEKRRIEGFRDLRRRRAVQWSILQHYEVCPTPLLDVSHSLTVACSFAQDAGKTSSYVYAVGLPLLTNRISINSEQDLINVRLLSICPPDALRPYFQEGYLVGTPDVSSDYESKAELDLARRLIAKFEIPHGQSFWGSGFGPLPRAVLYPKSDLVDEICDEVRAEIDRGYSTSEIGAFMKVWNEIEGRVLALASSIDDRVLNMRHAIQALALKGKISPEVASRLEDLRVIRNGVVHGHLAIRPGALRESIKQMKALEPALG